MKKRFTLTKGAGFHTHEIIEMALYPFVPRKDTNGIAHELMNKYGTLHSIASASEEELFEIKGMTKKAVRFLRKIPKLSKCYSSVRGKTKIKLLSVKDYYDRYAASLIESKGAEYNVSFLDDVQNLLLNNFSEYSDGKIRLSDIAASCVKTGAKYVVVSVYSDKLYPTREDVDAIIDVEYRIEETGAEILDYMKFDKGGCYSFFRVGYTEST